MLRAGRQGVNDHGPNRTSYAQRGSKILEVKRLGRQCLVFLFQRREATHDVDIVETSAIAQLTLIAVGNFDNIINLYGNGCFRNPTRLLYWFHDGILLAR